MDEIKALREEIAKLRERVAVLEAARVPVPPSSIDWGQRFMVGSPRLVPMEPLPPGTITCLARSPQ